jgi:hypothetical protein
MMVIKANHHIYIYIFITDIDGKKVDLMKKTCVTVELAKRSLLDGIVHSLLFEIGSTPTSFAAPGRAISSQIFPVNRVNTAMFQ